MDREGLSYLHVLNADRIEDVTKTLSNILQEAAENNSPDVDTLWKIISKFNSHNFHIGLITRCF